MQNKTEQLQQKALDIVNNLETQLPNAWESLALDVFRIGYFEIASGIAFLAVALLTGLAVKKAIAIAISYSEKSETYGASYKTDQEEARMIVAYISAAVFSITTIFLVCQGAANIESGSEKALAPNYYLLNKVVN